MNTGPEPAVEPPPLNWRDALWRQPAAFFTAVRFLTRVPIPDRLVPQGDDPAGLLRAAVVYFPAVGALIGLVTAGVIAAAGWLWPVWLAVFLGLAFEAVLTGAFHEDAVADFCDAFGGGWTRDDVLRILRDSRVGSFGALGLTLAVLLRAGGLAALDPGVLVAATVASATLGRWVILLVMATLAPVPGRDGLARDVGQQLTAGEVLFGSLLTIPGAVVWAVTDPSRVLAAVVVLPLFAAAFVLYVRRRLGGVTGDCLGCACYVGQVLVLLAATARWA